MRKRMRIWDIDPGYLNRQSLLGEHRELHAVVAIIAGGKSGYAQHPEVVRWAGCGWALRQRHRLLAAEMSLRGFADRTPVLKRANPWQWPRTYVDEPFRQFQLLESKYMNREEGRIPLPKDAQQLWSHHKYSVLARDTAAYKELGREVSGMKPRDDFSRLALSLTEMLRTQPTAGGIRNALQHMWGYVSDYPSDGKGSKGGVESWSPGRLLSELQRRAMASGNKYLLSSTALSELKAWMEGA